jgi:hypothetical protein
LASEHRRRLPGTLALTALCALACAKGPGSGVAALLQVEKATYASGNLAAVPDTAGPVVIGTYSRTSWVTPGQRGKLLDGTLGPGATAVLLGLEGDTGYWMLPASAPDTQTPDQPTFRATLGFATAIAGPEVQLRLVAVDLAGNTGAATLLPFSVLPVPAPSGALAVALAWDTEADLDLHVVDPLGAEIWSGDMFSPKPEPDAGITAGALDFDSNANCLIDGRRLETAAWDAPTAGHFLVRVDAYSLCAAAVAHWHVYVLRGSAVWLESEGVATGAEARFAKGRGQGVLALEFDWPGSI